MKQPQISLIAAMTQNRVLGKDNKMPWHLPAELAYFKKMTLNKPIVMGRKTFDSIGRPLPHRRNIIISRKIHTILDIECVNSLESAIQLLKDVPEIMIIGGASIYEQALPLADQLYLTYIDLECDGDAFFPEFDEEKFKIMSSEKHKADEKNPYDYEFVHYSVSKNISDTQNV